MIEIRAIFVLAGPRGGYSISRQDVAGHDKSRWSSFEEVAESLVGALQGVWADTLESIPSPRLSHRHHDQLDLLACPRAATGWEPTAHTSSFTPVSLSNTHTLSLFLTHAHTCTHTLPVGATEKFFFSHTILFLKAVSSQKVINIQVMLKQEN